MLQSGSGSQVAFDHGSRPIRDAGYALQILVVAATALSQFRLLPAPQDCNSYAALCMKMFCRDLPLFFRPTCRPLKIRCWVRRRGDWSIPEQATRAGEAIDTFVKFFSANL